MVSVKSFIAAAAAAIVSTTAYAADMPMPPPPQIVYQQAPCCETGRWYLRGDVGVGVQSFSSFDHSQTNSTFVWPASWTIVQKDIQDTSIFGMGVGYEWNSWFRFDVTGEYRTKAAFKATGRFTEFCAGGGNCFDVNTGNFSSAVFLANAYVDLGTWWCLTPFIGVGVGGARNMITGVQDLGLNTLGAPGFGFTLNDSSAWSLAWDVQAGLTYNVNDNLKIDFSCRFLNLGSPQTAVVQCQNTPLLSGRLLHAARLHLAGFPHRLALGVPGRRRIRICVDGAADLRRSNRNMPAPQPRSRNTLRFRRRNTSRRRPSNTCRCSRRCRAAADSLRANSFRDKPGRAARAKRMKERPMRWVFCFAMVLGMASPALAADYDLPILRGTAVPARRRRVTVGPATFTRWSGFYVGGAVSYSSATTDFSPATRPLVAFQLAQPDARDQVHPSQFEVLGRGSLVARLRRLPRLQHCSGRICLAAVCALLLLTNLAPTVEAVDACCLREPARETDERATDALGVLPCGAVRDGDAGARCRLRSSDPARHRGAGARDDRRPGDFHALERLLRRRRVQLRQRYLGLLHR